MIAVNLRKSLGCFTLDARFETASDGITVIFGRSGAGKTTLVNMLAGLARPDAGRIVVQDRVLFDSSAGIDLRPEARRVGYVFQDGRLFPHLTVKGNLRYGMRGGSGPVSFDAAVNMLGLERLLERRPASLSGGEKQRVAIGRALLANPRMLLMDEPLASLDAARKSEILPFIERLRDETGIPTVYVSHAIDEVVRLADTFVLLSDGQVAAVGPVEVLLSRLDLGPATGRYEAGAVVTAIVRPVQDQPGLTLLDFAGGTLRMPETALPAGQGLRLRIRARDVSLALEAPSSISVLNVFEGKVREITEEAGPQVDVLVDIGCPIRARVTRYALERLSIGPEQKVWVLIKAVALDRHSLGHLPISS